VLADQAIAPETRWPRSPAGGGRSAGVLSRSDGGRAITAFIWAAILLQRIGLPVGDSYVSPLVPLGLGLAGWLWCTRRAYLEPMRAMSCNVALSCVLVASLISGAAGQHISLLSVGLLLTLYLPFVLVLDTPGERAVVALFRAVRSVATVVAALALAQLSAQVLGVWSWSDLLAQVVPERFLVPGYVTSYPIIYGSSIYKSNGVLLLEPSVCSQVLALGIVSQLGLGRGRGRLAVLGAALLATVSGTGLIVLGAAWLVHILRHGTKQVIAGLALVSILLAGVAATPVSDLYTSRIAGSASESSSGYQRFVAPWERMGQTLDGPGWELLAGSGAGSAQTEADRIKIIKGVPAIDSPQSKLVTEYGWPAALMFVLFFLVVLVRGSPSPVLATSLTALYFVLGGGLLQAQTVLLIWVLTLPFVDRTRWPSGGPVPDRPRSAAHRR
jgi:hypothetical protein